MSSKYERVNIGSTCSDKFWVAYLPILAGGLHRNPLTLVVLIVSNPNNKLQEIHI
jgi:hypothetical protein